MQQDIMNVKGRIFNIQRFSIHDGPGIRTIVFLKGCPLRCRWCCNPESQDWKPETIVTAGVAKPVGRDVTVGEVIDEIARDRVYYSRSGGGGITLSGGECLWQPEFSTALLMAAKQIGISTAIETTGYADMDVIRKLLPFVDTVLMDIKHTNGEKHKAFTGKSNELMLENAKKVADSGMTNLVIRVPVIPTFNATEEEIRDIAKFAGSLKGVKKLHLLPYHRLGQDKYDGLGREYELKDILPPENDLMQKLLKVAIEASGLDCQIGG